MGSFRRPSTIISAISYIHITTQSGSKHSVHSQHHPRRVSSRYYILHTPIFTKMAVQSTMQPINTKIYNHQHLSQCKQSFDSTATSPTVLMASTACYSAVDLPLADPFASDIISISHKGHTGIHGDGYYGTDPSDGHTVWYCSECGDGPMGTWIPACTACGHSLCGSCNVEKAS